MTLPCPSCGGDECRVFYVVEGVPIASNVLVHDPEDAICFERGKIDLTVCHECGFIFNGAFRPDLIDYTVAYEESQAYSPAFREFQDQLVERLTRDYDLAGKTVFEIGCGKGAFLEALCRHSNALGLGIDPAFDDGRVTERRVGVVKEFFDESRTWMTGDLICCRHTLEHIQPVSRFLWLVRDSALNSPGSVVIFEVPDATRILEEGAFWDVYYEHCSYFTPSSLAWLFTSVGFEVRRLEREFDNQYLLLDASPGRPEVSNGPADIEAIIALCSRFPHRVRARTSRWRERLTRSTAAVLWGAGSKAVGFMTVVEEPDNAVAVVDINPYKQGSFLPGSARPVVPPEEVTRIDPDLVVVMNPIYVEEVTGMLVEMGSRADILTLGMPLETLQ